MKPKYCSPNSSRNTSSCFSNESLNIIAKTYNRRYPTKEQIIIPRKMSNDKQRDEFYKKISHKMNTITNCSEEYCWVNKMPEFFTEKMKQEFRPIRPKKWNKNKNTWLSTLDINYVLKQYEVNSNYKYIGAVPIDFDNEIAMGFCVVNELCKLDIRKIYLHGIRRLGTVFNFDPHSANGSHWVSLYSDFNNGGIYYFDSFANIPKPEIDNLMERIRTMGNDMIRKNEINIIDFDQEHQILADYEIVDDDCVLIHHSSFRILIDTPCYFLTKKSKKSKIPEIFNVTHTKLIGKKQLIFFDKKINKYPEKGQFIQKGFRKFYNNIRFQYEGSECGVYSIYFQVELLKGKTFSQVLKNIIDDDTINKQRDFYFRPNDGAKDDDNGIEYEDETDDSGTDDDMN